EQDIPVAQVAAALAKLAHGDIPFLLLPQKDEKQIKAKSKVKIVADSARIIPIDQGMERYRIEVGRSHGVKAGNIVGAISNEAGLDSKYIGNIDINQDFSLVDLPFGMPAETFNLLKKTWVRSQKMSISKCA
ncbi:MAG TPA: ATP-dependent helicase, partial [Desulfobacterales bacterium]|nr:ATP-dependent helicase [Desulfobacterales bacterium]